MATLNEILTRGVDKIYPSGTSLKRKLESKNKLRVYLGIDPTSPNIHIGHTIPLRKLGQFQELGHKVFLLFGDFTGMIGDPSGRDSQRQALSKEQILKNVSTYQEQAAKILSFEKNPPEIVYNSTWLGKIPASRFFELFSRFTVSQLIERDLFQERIKNKKPISVSEFLYPILQGYDSVELDVDLEIGATDQTFNMLVGRDLQASMRNREKFVLTAPLLEGTDGRKMSKTYGNTIDISLKPNDMYGKTMSLDDSLIIKYLDLTTNLNSDDVQDIETKLKNNSLNPMDAKKKLAFELVKIYHGDSAAKKAQSEFENVFQKGKRTSNIKMVRQPLSSLPTSYASLTADTGGTTSVSAAIGLAKSKGLRVNGKVIENAREVIKNPGKETVIDIGKRKSVKIIWEDK
jgi:tyrosyl-tRNA synthetase